MEACPQCSSSRLYKDGLRYLGSGDKVQRWLCRDCGLRFSEGLPLKRNRYWQLNRANGLHTDNQICALKDAKNLATAENIKTAGVSPQADAKGQIVTFSFWLLKQGYSQQPLQDE